MLIPNGLYKAKITDGAWQANRNNNGHYLKLVFTIMDSPTETGQKITQYFNFDNPNPIAVELSQKSWVNFCYAGNFGALKFDFKNGPSAELVLNLVGTAMCIEIDIKKNNDGITRNKISLFRALSTYVSPQVIAKEHAEKLFDKSAPPATDPNDYPTPNMDDLDDEIPF